MKNLYLNPLYLFGYAFLAAMGMYALSLSGLYVNGDSTLTITLFILSVLSLMLGFIFDSIFRAKMNSELKYGEYDKFLTPNYIFILLGFFVDCLASGAVPLFNILRGDLYEYKDFGLKTFHVFYMAYMSAFSIVSFERYFITKNKISSSSINWIGNNNTYCEPRSYNAFGYADGIAVPFPKKAGKKTGKIKRIFYYNGGVNFCYRVWLYW
jgi:drug/metabolite transporter (DMT)-like permease